MPKISPHEHLGRDHPEGEHPESGHPDHAEFLIPHEDRLLGPPFLIGEQAGAHKNTSALKGSRSRISSFSAWS